MPAIDVERVAKLAMLPLTDDEKKLFASQLSSILSYVAKLNEVDTTNVEPTAQVTGLTNVFREDEVDTTRILSQNEALKNAPASYNGFVKVKVIIWR
jgi:aspartyl-tRNA(Asn)/glutamyl-tRNA(Gln) amidotransferase subunit C